MTPFNFALASVSPKHANSSSECNLNEVSDKALFRRGGKKEIRVFSWSSVYLVFNALYILVIELIKRSSFRYVLSH